MDMCGDRPNDRRVYSIMIYICSCFYSLDTGSWLERETNTRTFPIIPKSCAVNCVFCPDRGPDSVALVLAVAG